MKNQWRSLAVLITALCLTGNRATAQKPLPNPLRDFVSLSDIHFNPYNDTSLLKKLVLSDVKKWKTIFSAAHSPRSSYKSDPNYTLVSSALQAAKARVPNPKYVLVTGDFLCHNFRQTYATVCWQYPDSFQSFTAKTIQFVAGLLAETFPKATVLPVLGNNDSYCGDYMMEPNSSFLRMFAKAWVPLQHNNSKAKDDAFVQQFSKGGYYTFPFNNGTNGQFIMMNTVFMSHSFEDTCSYIVGSPAETELNWLDSVLQAGKQATWMAYHIPPGADVYSTLRYGGNDSCDTTSVTLMWQPQWNDWFLQTMRTHASRIKASFAGHTHMDDFRILYQDTTPSGFVHITPAVSPDFGNNPGFQRISYNTKTMQLQNVETFFVDLNQTGSSWQSEYDFRKTYGIPNLTPATMQAVWTKIMTNPLYRGYYEAYYDLQSPAQDVNNTNWHAYGCGITGTTPAAFCKCRCSKK